MCNLCNEKCTEASHVVLIENVLRKKNVREFLISIRAKQT